MMKSVTERNDSFLKIVDLVLFTCVLLMISSFFTWSESIVVSRVIKTVGRLSLLGVLLFLYLQVKSFGAVDNLYIKNPASFFLYVGYLLMGLASFMWTSDIFVSALQWVMTTESFVFSFLFVKIISMVDIYFPGHRIRLYKLLGNSVFILSLVFAIGLQVNPDDFMRETMGGEEQRLGGLMMNPNELGMLAGVGIVSLIFNYYHKERIVWTSIKIIVMLYVLWMTGSRSSLVGVLLVVFFHFAQSENLKLKILLFSVTFMVTPVAVNHIILKNDASRLEEVLSMTGRLPFWKALITEGLPQSPYIGYGFMRIAKKDYFQGEDTYPGKMTHNTFIQVMMNLGLIGFGLVMLQLFSTLRAFAKEKGEKKLVLIGIMIPITINSFTEFGIFGECNYGLLFYQILIVSVAFANKSVLSPKQRLFLQRKRPDLGISIS